MTKGLNVFNSLSLSRHHEYLTSASLLEKNLTMRWFWKHIGINVYVIEDNYFGP